MKPFIFKQFEIKQNKSAMKVGTDGVLLGAWCNVPDKTCRILDIGTGTGLIALMVAQRCKQAYIDGIEIDKEAANEAAENCAKSPFFNRINIIHSALQQYQPVLKYDLIVCNPPYFNNSLKNPDKNREIARHTTTLNFDELLKYSIRLLNPNGILALILPYDEKNNFMEYVYKSEFKIKRETEVYSTKTSLNAKRIMMEFCLTDSNMIIEKNKITIEKERHLYTSEYIDLTKDFYLNM